MAIAAKKRKDAQSYIMRGEQLYHAYPKLRSYDIVSAVEMDGSIYRALCDKLTGGYHRWWAEFCMEHDCDLIIADAKNRQNFYVQFRREFAKREWSIKKPFAAISSKSIGDEVWCVHWRRENETVNPFSSKAIKKKEQPNIEEEQAINALVEELEETDRVKCESQAVAGVIGEIWKRKHPPHEGRFLRTTPSRSGYTLSVITSLP